MRASLRRFPDSRSGRSRRRSELLPKRAKASVSRLAPPGYLRFPVRRSLTEDDRTLQRMRLSPKVFPDSRLPKRAERAPPNSPERANASDPTSESAKYGNLRPSSVPRLTLETATRHSPREAPVSRGGAGDAPAFVISGRSRRGRRLLASLRRGSPCRGGASPL